MWGTGREDPSAITVVLADGQALIREALAALLRREPDLAIVAETSDGDEALRHVQRLRPRVAVLDPCMRGMTGIEIARIVGEERLPTAVVILSVHRDLEHVRTASGAGALGYVLRQGPKREFLAAIRAAAVRRAYTSSLVEKGRPERRLRGEPANHALSRRERDVLRFLADGSTSRETAAALGITVRTVEWYRATTRRKLGITSLAGLVKFAIRNGLATLGE